MGLTLPGMIELPGSLAGSLSSAILQRGPEPSQRMSLAIFIRVTARPRNVALAATIPSSPPRASILLGAVTKGLPVRLATSAAISGPEVVGRVQSATDSRPAGR